VFAADRYQPQLFIESAGRVLETRSTPAILQRIHQGTLVYKGDSCGVGVAALSSLRKKLHRGTGGMGAGAGALVGGRAGACALAGGA
jgi:hypothetical protein